MIDAKKFLSLFCFGSLAAIGAGLPAASAWADVKAGVDAWTAGDYSRAVKEWMPLAKRGDADAQFNLAQAYKLGRGVPTNLEKAKELYGKAAAQGHVQAADIFGLLLFQDGEREKALPYLKASAAHGDPRAQYILGVAHFNGDLVEKDWVRAYALVSLAQQAGLPQATRALAQMDSFIPLADRQKSVILSTQIAADAEATRERLATSTELGGAPVAGEAMLPPMADAVPPAASVHRASSPDMAIADAARLAGSDSPATAGADYARPQSPPAQVASGPAPASPAVPARPAAAVAPPRSVAVPSAPAASGPWRAQLGAFGVPGNANALWAKVKSRPELSGHGKLLVPAGRLTKLQAGGFATKAEADAACSRLTAGGFTCLAVQD
ncbi:SPOR domain-containing protein [Novosphingobium album (ex Hu et al. 2023)]|uniref:SPOR domain-containing protein n=1 Tax=Novosphingobium album (ex Hu et al. 2023) TaxID=2930093 RepID=A0ABT0AXL4_9SPHN|nr:SPOR domain-containing protein [Novosphingobium album (ex Hu et al. 2023)]MCJ2177299.1 SPOR domain-containing protein [Novosphingobium album (ex Hu et al. 2023)]